jgi:hypothetical protein
MSDEFVLTVQFKGEEHHFESSLIRRGYTHQLRVLIDNKEVFFEPDEEGHYRAVKMPGQEMHEFDKIDKALLRAIQKEIEDTLA